VLNRTKFHKPYVPLLSDITTEEEREGTGTKPSNVLRILKAFSIIIILAVTVLSVRPVSAANVFADGFESGDFSAWTSTGGSPAVTNSTSHHGAYSASFDAEEYCLKNYGGTNNVIYARCYMKWSSPLSSSSFFYVNLVGVFGYSNVFRVLLYNNGIDVVWGIIVRENTVFNTYYSTQQRNPSANAWHCVEIMADMSTSDGITDGNYRIWINGDELTDVARTNVDTDYTYNNAMVAGTERYEYGGTVYLDCFVVDTTYIGPECGLTVNVVGSGSVVKIPDQAVYDWGTNVTLTANPTVGWSFDHWSGDASGTVNPVTVNMTSDKTVTATFTQDTYALTIMVIGSGSVNLNNSGLYYYGDVVELTAVPAIGWSFDNWTGDLNASANPATILIDGDKMVTATFTQNEYTLTVGTVGNGNINLNNTGPYHYGDIVELTAVPVTGWSFQDWSGDLLGSVNPSTILIDGNKAVTATFTQNTYTLAITTVGSGSVNLNNSGPYHYGDVVELTAVPTAGWTFSVWSGHLFGSANPTTLFIDGNKAVTATFIQSQYTLTVTTVGSGSVVLNNTGPYHLGDAIQLTANPTVGWSFDHWSSDLSGSTNPATIIINVNKAVTATFTQNTYALSVSIAPVGAGSVNLNNTGPYHYGDVVQLTAVPTVGFSFGHWSGDLSGSVNPTTIVINGNKAVTASFTQPAPVGGYSIHISTRNTVQPSAAYAGLVCLFGAVLAALRRKKK
jgi:hypothetical protein